MTIDNILSNLMEQLETRQVEQIQNSWCMVDKATRKFRLNTIIALIVELEEIKKTSSFSIVFGYMAIEAVICGDWRELEEVVELQYFKGEEPDTSNKYAPLWEKFRLIAETAIAEEKCRTNTEKKLS
jgi:hypothetical protein